MATDSHEKASGLTPARSRPEMALPRNKAELETI